MVKPLDMIDEARRTLAALVVVDARLVAALDVSSDSSRIEAVLPRPCDFRLPFAPTRYRFSFLHMLDHAPTDAAEVLSVVDSAFREAGLELSTGEGGVSAPTRVETQGGTRFVVVRPQPGAGLGDRVIVRVYSRCMRLPRGYESVIALARDWHELLGYSTDSIPQN